jgi:type II secretory pathway pseudopilin PulG
MNTFSRHPLIRRTGFSLLESMILVVILGIVSLSFGICLQTSVRVAPAVDLRLAIHTRLVDKMEDLASLDFATISANSGLSDSVTIGNQSYSRTVTVSPYDADGNGSADSDCLEVTVTINGQYLKTRVTQP